MAPELGAGVVVRYDVVHGGDIGRGPGLGVYVDVLIVGVLWYDGRRWTDVVDAGMLNVGGG